MTLRTLRHYPFGMQMPGRKYPAVVPPAPSGGGTATAPVEVYRHGFKSQASGTSTVYTAAPNVLSPYLDSSKWTLSTPGQAGAFVTFASPVTSGPSMDSALGFSVSPTVGSTMTLTFKVKPGYRLNILSFSFYHRSTSTAGNGYRNWLLTINGLQVGADTLNYSSIPLVPTGTLPVTNPANGLTGTVTVVLHFSGSADKTGTLRIDNFVLNGYLEQIPETGSNPITSTDGKGYRYGFNDKEHDDDINAEDYDFGSRIYDPKLGRFFSKDLLRNEYESQYGFAGNNPVGQTDFNGNFKISPFFVQRYPTLAKMLKYVLPELIHNEQVRDAWINNIGFDNKQDGIKAWEEMLTFGKGPWVTPDRPRSEKRRWNQPLESFFDDDGGEYDQYSYPDNVKVPSSHMRQLEAAISGGDSKEKGYQMFLAMLFVMH